MKVSETTGRNYCFQPKRLCLQDGSQTAMLDRSLYNMSAPAVKRDGGWYLPEGEAARLFDISVTDGETEVCALAEALRLPIFEAGEYLSIGLDGEIQPISGHERRMVGWQMSERHVGELFRASWFPQTGRLNSYRLYVPSCWLTAPTGKMAVVLHGAGSNEHAVFDRAEGRLSYYAEKYGYLILAPNSLVSRSNYGGSIPPSGQFPTPKFRDSEGKPQYYSEEERAENAVAEACVMEVMEAVIQEFAVDRSKVFLMGNSMGGIGTYYLGGKYDIFRALCPAGAILEPLAADWSVYGEKPILFVAGTEDHNGYENMVRDFHYIRKQGVKIRMLTVGGGIHSDAWTKELPAIFEFFDEQL